MPQQKHTTGTHFCTFPALFVRGEGAGRSSCRLSAGGALRLPGDPRAQEAGTRARALPAAERLHPKIKDTNSRFEDKLYQQC
eukprot:641596-Rhodomonas_salina.1